MLFLSVFINLIKQYNKWPECVSSRDAPAWQHVCRGKQGLCVAVSMALEEQYVEVKGYGKYMRAV